MKNIIAIFLLISSLSINAQIDENHLKLGEKAPNFTGFDQFGEYINTKHVLKDKPILLVFYRGGWCTFCKKHLTELQENLQTFTQKGYYVIVVTPEKVEKTKETTEKLNLSFSILHDFDNKIMKSYQVLYEINEQNVTNYYNLIKQKVMEYNVNQNLVLPVTATYIINKKGKIGFVQYNPDYSKRADFKEMLKSL